MATTITTTLLLDNIIFVGLVGCVIFTAFILLVALTGLFSVVRDDNGKFKKLSWQGAMAFGFFLTFFFGVLYYGNCRLVSQIEKEVEMNDINTANEMTATFWTLWLNAFGTLLVIHLYDLLVLDYLVVVKWHPAWANMPNTPYFTTFRPHVIGFVRGIPFGMLCSALVSFPSLYD